MKFHIESSSGVPISRQLADQISMACAGGELQPGQRLPSVRELARQLAVNQNTVHHVYQRLTATGLLDQRHGDGTYVADQISGARLRSQLRAQNEQLRDDLNQIVRRARALGVEPPALHELLDEALEMPISSEKRT